jgi:carbonic anhydrase
MQKRLTYRRISMQIFMLTFALILALCSSVAIASDDSQNSQVMTGQEAWDTLMLGNQRFVAGERMDIDYQSRRAELTTSQHPFVTVITCSDSRVPPELLFDQGLGDIFTIRIAGNVVNEIDLGSVEYGVEHLHTPLLVVLGHESCGAVTAAVEGGAEGNIDSIMKEIEPAVETARKTNKTGTELVEEAVNENVKSVIDTILEESPVTKKLVDEGKLTIVGAKYFISTGEVEVLEGRPNEPEATETSNESAPANVSGAYVRPAITTSDKAWDELMKGNQRFVASELAVRDFPSRRAELTASQQPYATVITCSDSRVPPELLFDQGLGDIFVVRVAGNVVDGVELGSIEYGVEHLHTPLLVVLGHQSCGAVTAAVEGGAEGNIESIMKEIEPAVETARKTNKTGTELVEEAVNDNVELVIQNILNRSPVTKELVEEGKLEIVAAKYFLDTGEVELIEVTEPAEEKPTVLSTAVTPSTAATPSTPGFCAFAMAGVLGILMLLPRKQR